MPRYYKCELCGPEASELHVNNRARHRRSHERNYTSTGSEKLRQNSTEHGGTSKGHKEGPDANALLQEFLQTRDSPQAPYAAAFQAEIDRAGGLSPLGLLRGNEDWANDVFDAPFKFEGEECWNGEMSDVKLLNDILHDYDKTKDAVYSNTEPHHPQDEANIAEVLDQLHVPNPSAVKYAVNMGQGNAVKKPMRLLHHETDSNLITTTNITPKHTIVELHAGKLIPLLMDRQMLIDSADRGYHGITVLRKGCIKLWGLYPLTDNNSELWQKYCTSETPFIALQGKLERGEFTVQSAPDAIYLPPHCLHITVTLKGGLVPGINYTTADCLQVASKLLRIELSSFQEPRPTDFRPLLECILKCLQDELPIRREEALKALCSFSSQLRRGNLDTLKRIKNELKEESACNTCKRKWASHWSRG